MSKSSLLDAFIRSAASGATFDYANNIAAAGDATIPLDAGASNAPDWLARYRQNMAAQSHQDMLAKGQHGNGWTFGNFAGQTLNPIYRLLPSAATPLGMASQVPPMLTQQQLDEPGGPKPLGIFGSGWGLFGGSP